MNMALSNNVDSDSGVGVGNILATLTPTPIPPKTFDSDLLRLRLRNGLVVRATLQPWCVRAELSADTEADGRINSEN